MLNVNSSCLTLHARSFSCCRYTRSWRIKLSLSLSVYPLYMYIHAGSSFYADYSCKYSPKFAKDLVWLHAHESKKERFLYPRNNTGDFPIRKPEKHATRRRSINTQNPSAALNFLLEGILCFQIQISASLSIINLLIVLGQV